MDGDHQLFDFSSHSLWISFLLYSGSDKKLRLGSEIIEFFVVLMGDLDSHAGSELANPKRSCRNESESHPSFYHARYAADGHRLRRQNGARRHLERGDDF